MITTRQRLAMAEMYAQGYVTLRELAAQWGEAYANVKSMRSRGALKGAILGPDGRMWFVPAETARPEPQHYCGRPRGRPRGAMKRAAAYLSVARAPVVPLEPEWARWGVFGHPDGGQYLGWLGPYSRAEALPEELPGLPKSGTGDDRALTASPSYASSCTSNTEPPPAAQATRAAGMSLPGCHPGLSYSARWKGGGLAP